MITHPNLTQSNTRYSNFSGFSIAAAWNRFIRYASMQEEKRFLWTAISILGHATFFTIGTLILVIAAGNDFLLLTATCITMAVVLAVNLAALPTKYTIPIFFFSLLADFAIMITALAFWFN